MVARERLISFGHGQSGILHDSGAPQARRTPIVFVNAGIVSRIGPHRLYVRLARSFAAAGHPCLRFDLSGFGDGPAATRPYEEQALADIGAAVTAVRPDDSDDNSVILLGLCSGSEHAYRYALQDATVSGLMLLDPHSYSSTRSKIDRTAEKMIDPARVGRVMGRAVGLVSKPEPAPGEVDPTFTAVIDRPDPPREEWARDLSALTERGVEIYIRYTRFVEEELTKPAHFFDAFRDTDLHDRVHVEVDRLSDHTYTPLEAQTRLRVSCLEWLAARGTK